MTAKDRSIMNQQAWREVTSELRLSPREAEVVQHVFDDETERTIANLLGISSHTVHTHLERVYRKLGVRSRVQLVVRVMSEFTQQRIPQRPLSTTAEERVA